MGEDLFAQKCMDLMGVAKQENFGLTTDVAREGQSVATLVQAGRKGASDAGLLPVTHPFVVQICRAALVQGLDQSRLRRIGPLRHHLRAAIEFVRTTSSS